jgi:putative transcriptional regulator
MKRRPTAAAIHAARKHAELTQTEAAQRIYSTLRTWQDWEAGARRMHPALFELFLLKTGQLNATKGAA